MGGYGTSLISLYLPCGSQQSDYNELIKHAYSKSSNIKDKKVKNNIKSALKSIQEKLKLYKTLPCNGLVIFAGVIEYYV